MPRAVSPRSSMKHQADGVSCGRGLFQTAHSTLSFSSVSFPESPAYRLQLRVPGSLRRPSLDRRFYKSLKGTRSGLTSTQRWLSQEANSFACQSDGADFRTAEMGGSAASLRAGSWRDILAKLAVHVTCQRCGGGLIQLDVFLESRAGVPAEDRIRVLAVGQLLGLLVAGHGATDPCGQVF